MKHTPSTGVEMPKEKKEWLLADKGAPLLSLTWPIKVRQQMYSKYTGSNSARPHADWPSVNMAAVSHLPAKS